MFIDVKARAFVRIQVQYIPKCKCVFNCCVIYEEPDGAETGHTGSSPLLAASVDSAGF